MSNTSTFISAIIGTEILSFIICLVLLIGSTMGNWRKSKRNSWFILLIFITMAGCFCDLCSWLLDGHPEWTPVLHLTTLCSMVMTIIMVGTFISYLSAYVSEKKVVSNVRLIFGWIMVMVGAIATIIAGTAGKLFVFQDGCYLEKPLYSAYVIANTGYFVVGIIVILGYRNVLDLYDKLAGYAYILIPAASALIGLCVEGWDFSYPAITVSLLILYIMIQSDRTKSLEKEGIIANYQAEHDELTGLFNRNAYQSHILRMKSEEGNCGVIFGDLNGLKYTNDTCGHKAGDQLLIHYAEILTNLFRMNEIYRIGGDEFICLMENAPEDIFRKRVDDLKSVLDQNGAPLACIGASYGRVKDIELLVRDAEVRMYAEKKVVHENFPEMSREMH